MKRQRQVTLLCLTLLFFSVNLKASTVYLNEDTTISSGIYQLVESRADIDMTGGRIEERWVVSQGANGGTVNLYDGWIQGMTITGNASVNIYGSTINETLWIQAGIVNIYGGNICKGHYEPGKDYYGRIIADSSVHQPSIKINIYGTDLILVPTGGFWGGGYIEGKWLDQTSFHIDLDNYLYSSTNKTYSVVALHEIPEPASAAIMILGAVWMAAKRKNM